MSALFICHQKPPTPGALAFRRRQCAKKRLKIRRDLTVNRDTFPRPWMNKLQMPGVQSHASDAPLERFFRMVLSVANDGMGDRRKLHPDLILQSGYQGDAHQRRSTKPSFDGISQFRPSRLRAGRGGQLLKHALTAKIVDERFFFGASVDAEVSANDSQILPHRSMAEELSYQCVAITLGLCEQQHSRGKAIDAMHNVRALPAGFQFRGEQ